MLDEEGLEVHEAERASNSSILECINLKKSLTNSISGLSEPEIEFRSEKMLVLKIYPIVGENKALIINKQDYATDTPDFITSFSSDCEITHSTELDCSCQPEESSMFKRQINTNSKDP